jgi:hypothetical protein
MPGRCGSVAAAVSVRCSAGWARRFGWLDMFDTAEEGRVRVKPGKEERRARCCRRERKAWGGVGRGNGGIDEGVCLFVEIVAGADFSGLCTECTFIRRDRMHLLCLLLI